MKRILLAAAAALTLAGPLMASPAFARDYRSEYRQDRREWRDDRRDDRRDYRNDRRDYRSDRWDSRRYNGYYYQNRFYRGAPPAAYYGRPGFSYGYQAWSRGQYIPRGYPVRVVEYRNYRLAPPPRGYHYVRDDRGDILLAAIATGLIASVIAGGAY
jgi:Ni/Co efflux regulator RcnB